MGCRIRSRSGARFSRWNYLLVVEFELLSPNEPLPGFVVPGDRLFLPLLLVLLLVPVAGDPVEPVPVPLCDPVAPVAGDPVEPVPAPC